MDIDDILKARPTESEFASKKIMVETAVLVEEEGWRWYVSTENPITNSLIGRFLSAHARVPDMFSPVYSPIPLQIIEWSDDGSLYKGAVWMNGVVFVAQHEDDEVVYNLFVTEETAKSWGYPK